MKVRRGDIVLLAFPFSAGRGHKVRPVVIVQDDRNNDRLKNTIVAMITSTTGQARREPTQLLIDVRTFEGQQAGLLHTSAIKCENLFTIETAIVARKVGHLPPATMEQVDRCLKVSLGLA